MTARSDNLSDHGNDPTHSVNKFVELPLKEQIAAEVAAITADVATEAAARVWRNQRARRLDPLAGLPASHSAVILERAARVTEWTATVPALKDLAAVIRVADDPDKVDDFFGALSRFPDSNVQDIDRLADEAARIFVEIAPPESEASRLGTKLANGEETAIRDEAERQARAARAMALAGLERHDPVEQNEKSSERWWRRRLRREALAAQSYFDSALRMATPASPFCSTFTLDAYQDRRDRNAAWAASTSAVFDDGTAVPLATIQQNARKAKLSQLHAVTKALEWCAGEMGYLALFITVTLPGPYHSYSVGEQARDGSYPRQHVNDDWTPAHGPKAQMSALNGLWRQFRARLAKFPALRRYFGLKVVESHTNGTPHLHALIFVPAEAAGRDGVPRSTIEIVGEALGALAPGRQSKLEVIDRNGPEIERRMPDGSVQRIRRASPATYVLKYVMKGLESDEAELRELGIELGNKPAADGEEHILGEGGARYRAWAQARRIRRFALLGIAGSIRIWQRIWTASEDEAMPRRVRAVWRAMQEAKAAGARAKDAATDEEKRAARRDQAEATATALGLIGAVGEFDDGGGLRLSYVETETEHGRPVRKPDAIRDVRTGETFPLRRQNARLVSNRELGAGVTVAAICPSDPPAAGHRKPDPVLEAVVGDLERLIADRECQQNWQDWCDRARRRVVRLRAPPADPENDDEALQAA